MDIQKVDMADLELVKHFVSQVSEVDVLPLIRYDRRYRNQPALVGECGWFL